MKCAKCQFENPEGLTFCGKCGEKLEIVCPKCKFSNPPDFIYCGKCGNNLTLPIGLTALELSFHEKLAKIQRYLPKDLAQKILAQKGKIEGERKQVTVMFCDMAGFTSLTEKLGSEQMYSIMDKVYEILIHQGSRFHVFKRFMRHYVTPVTCCISDAKKDRLVFTACSFQRLIAPGIPINRIFSVL